FDGEATGDNLGFTLTCCDLNRDGRADVILSAPGADVNQISNAGRVYAYSGKDGGLLFSVNGFSSNGQFGFALACADMDGDRFPDLIVGAPVQDFGGVSKAGAVYVYSGKSGLLLRGFSSGHSGSRFGSSVA